MKKLLSEITTTPGFHSCIYTFLSSDSNELNHDNLSNAFLEIVRNCNSYMREGSNWAINFINWLELYTCKYSPLE